MPSGDLPTYAYRPANRGEPQLRTCSSLRARLFAGGTYFRVRDPGQQGNLISVQVIEYAADDAVCVVTNYQLKTDELVTGPVSAEVFDVQLKFDDKVVIDELTTQPRARIYSISFKIAPPPDSPTELGTVRLDRLIALPGKLAAKLTPSVPVFAPGDEIIITPRRRVYRLIPNTAPQPDTGSGPGAPAAGWDIANLRMQINANDPWIEMLPRAFVPDMGPPPVPPDLPPTPERQPGSDKQDTTQDGASLLPFAETRMKGGDGLPTSPDLEQTGPYRSLVHVNYGETQDGGLTELNVVYEWAGDSSNEGNWKIY